MSTQIVMPEEPTEGMLLAAKKAAEDYQTFEDWLEDDGAMVIKMYRAMREALL